MNKLIVNLIFVISFQCFGQLEELHLAKKEAKEHHYEDALKQLESGLETYPNDHDLMVYQTRIYLWQQEWSKAVENLALLQFLYPASKEVAEVWYLYLSWQRKWRLLQSKSSEFLEIIPNDSLSTYYYLKSLILQGKLDSLENHSLTKYNLKGMFHYVRDSLRKPYFLKIRSGASYFKANRLSPWYTSSMQIGAKNKLSWDAHITHSSRFDERGVQMGASVYPKFSKTLNGKLELQYSPNEIFPSWVLDISVVKSVKKMEFGSGMISRTFSNARSYSPYLNVGYYGGPFYLAIRPTLNKMYDQAGITVSNLVRVYLTREGFLQLSHSQGRYPSIISIEEGIGWITVKSLNFKARLPLSNSVHSEVIIGLQSEEIDERLNRTSTQIEFAFQFAF